MKRKQQNALTLALGSALAASLASAPATAANPFASQALAKGYMVAAVFTRLSELTGQTKPVNQKISFFPSKNLVKKRLLN